MTAIEWVEFQQVQACGGQGIRYCMEECPLRPDCVWRMRAGIARLERGRRVSEQVSEAAEAFLRASGIRPEYAFVWRMPSGAEEGAEVDGVMLIEAGWAPEGYVALVNRRAEVETERVEVIGER
jgi:hypothetical protein